MLAQLAAGRTNREIAAQLLISQHTVARHLENIYAKLAVRTRAAATAYAYEHDLVEVVGHSSQPPGSGFGMGRPGDARLATRSVPSRA